MCLSVRKYKSRMGENASQDDIDSLTLIMVFAIWSSVIVKTQMSIDFLALSRVETNLWKLSSEGKKTGLTKMVFLRSLSLSLSLSW